MDNYEDENPFETDVDHVPSETSSTSKVNISASSSPPSSARLLLSPTSPAVSRPFPSPGTTRHPQMAYKSDYCCIRDQWLHSGEDVEILVRRSSTAVCD